MAALDGKVVSCRPGTCDRLPVAAPDKVGAGRAGARLVRMPG